VHRQVFRGERDMSKVSTGNSSESPT